MKTWDWKMQDHERCKSRKLRTGKSGTKFVGVEMQDWKTWERPTWIAKCNKIEFVDA